MRWVFIALVVMNVVYFGLHYGERSVQTFESVPAPSVVEGVSSLVLLRELKEERLEGMMAAKERLKMTVKDEGADPLCTLVGPFRELLKAEFFSERLMALDIVSQVEQVEVAGEEGFWVYQSSRLSRKAALRRLYEFQAKGIDSYIIPRGELENGISFGIYPSMEEAEVKRAEIVSLGFDVEIRSADRSYQEIWLILQPQEAQKADEEMWLELINPKDNVELVQNYCPGVASR